MAFSAKNNANRKPATCKDEFARTGGCEIASSDSHSLAALLAKLKRVGASA
jgi:hypothetical protein